MIEYCFTTHLLFSSIPFLHSPTRSHFLHSIYHASWAHLDISPFLLCLRYLGCHTLRYHTAHAPTFLPRAAATPLRRACACIIMASLPFCLPVLLWDLLWDRYLLLPVILHLTTPAFRPGCSYRMPSHHLPLEPHSSRSRRRYLHHVPVSLPFLPLLLPFSFYLTRRFVLHTPLPRTLLAQTPSPAPSVQHCGMRLT